MDQEQAEVDPYEELVRQEQIQVVALRLNVDPANVKPCFARIAPVEMHSRNNTAYAYSTELRRMGVAEAIAWRSVGDAQSWLSDQYNLATVPGVEVQPDWLAERLGRLPFSPLRINVIINDAVTAAANEG